jgi:hypothetical protein
VNGDPFPFEALPSKRWPGWTALLCRRFGQTFVIGYYRTGRIEDETRLAKDIRQLRAIWAQTVTRQQQTRAAVAALTSERDEL